MANLNKELRKIFFTTLKRKAEEATRRTSPTYCGGITPPVTHRPNIYQPNLFSQTDSIGCIYFYEWSDTKRTPKTYYTLKAFESFLNDCHIYLVSWQREVLSHMKHPYVACKKGERDIIIKNSYTELTKAIEEGSEAATAPFTPSKPTLPKSMKPMTEREPYQVSITRPFIGPNRMLQPVFEPEGRWNEDGSWFG